MNPNLRDVAQQGSIDALYSLIRSDAYVLDKVDALPFADTPLHIAASLGHITFAMEIMRLKSSFARKLNEDGYTPLHLALQIGNAQVALQLIDIDGDLVRVSGREGLTPLHYVAQKGDVDLLTKFLKVCPRSIEDRIVRRESVLHIALKSNKISTLKILLGWLRRAWLKNAIFWEKKLLNWQDEEGNTLLHIAVFENQPEILLGWLRRAWLKNAIFWEKKLLNWQDEEGNTLLHIAVFENQPEIVRLLLKFKLYFCCKIALNVRNSGGNTVFDILNTQKKENKEIKKMLRSARLFRTFLCPRVPSLEEYFQSSVPIDEKLYIFLLRQRTNISNESPNVLLVVAVLLVTVTYQAIMSPPGGVWQADPNATAPSYATPGSSVLRGYSFLIVAGLNVISYFATIFAIFVLLPGDLKSGMINLPLHLLSLYFIAAMLITAPDDVFFGWVSCGAKNYFIFCIFSPLLLLLLRFFVNYRRRKLVNAFHPDLKLLDPTLT